MASMQMHTLSERLSEERGLPAPGPQELDPAKARAIVKGDSKSVAIAAASIIAKVTRRCCARSWECQASAPQLVFLWGRGLPGHTCGGGLSSHWHSPPRPQVTRDRLMLQYHEQYPQYGFDGHKGYGVPAHIEAIRKHGPCPIHRRTFAPIKTWWPPEAKDS